jgi:hypothetical protein
MFPRPPRGGCPSTASPHCAPRAQHTTPSAVNCTPTRLSGPILRPEGRGPPPAPACVNMHLSQAEPGGRPANNHTHPVPSTAHSHALYYGQEGAAPPAAPACRNMHLRQAEQVAGQQTTTHTRAVNCTPKAPPALYYGQEGAPQLPASACISTHPRQWGQAQGQHSTASCTPHPLTQNLGQGHPHLPPSLCTRTTA